MRVVNRLLAFLLAAALIAVSLIVIIEVIAARAHLDPVVINWHAILHWGERNTWPAASVILACAITTAAGLLLLVPQLIPRRITRLALDTDDETDAALTRRGLAVSIRGAVTDVEGVVRAKVKVHRHRISVYAMTAAATAEGAGKLEPHVHEVATRQLDALHLHTRRRVQVSVDRRRVGGV